MQFKTNTKPEKYARGAQAFAEQSVIVETQVFKSTSSTGKIKLGIQFSPM